MEIINRSGLLLAAADARGATARSCWLTVAENARWKSFEDLQRTFALAREAAGYVVFTIEHLETKAFCDFSHDRLYLLHCPEQRGKSMNETPNSDYLELVKAFPLVPIRDFKHLERAVEFMTQLTIPNTTLSEGAADYLSVLGTLISQFEKHKKMSSEEMMPQDALKYLLTVNELSQADIVHLVGQKSNLSAFLNGKRALSKQAALNLSEFFKVSPALFQRREDVPAWLKAKLTTSAFGITLSLAGETMNGRKLDDLLLVGNLSSLDLSHAKVTDEMLTKIAKMRHLKSLDLSFTDITDKGAASLSQLRFLQCLSLKNTKVTDATLEHIGKISSLTNVNLLGTKLDGSGFKHLSGITQSWFWFGATPFDESALQAVVDAQLKKVGFYFDTINDDGVKIVAHSKALYELCLYSNVSSRIVESLAQCKSLKRLWLGCTQRISDADIDQLAKLKDLEMLELSGCLLITEAGAAKLRERISAQVVRRRDDTKPT